MSAFFLLLGVPLMGPTVGAPVLSPPPRIPGFSPIDFERAEAQRATDHRAQVEQDNRNALVVEATKREAQRVAAIRKSRKGARA